MRNPEKCCVCRSSTEQYLRSLKTCRTDLQVQALACILDRKTTPIPTPTIPPPIITHVRPPRGRDEQIAFIIRFVRDSDQTFNEWRTTSIREDTYSMHHINGITRTYNFFIASIFSRRSFAAAQRDMVAINDFLENVLNV